MQVTPQKNKPKRISKRYIILGLIPILLVLGYLYTSYLPAWINIEKYKSRIINEATSKLKKYNINISKLSLELPLTGDALFKAKYLIISRKNGEPLVSGENIQVKVALLPLAKRVIAIKEINIDNLKLTLVRKSSGKMNIDDIFKLPKTKSKFNLKLQGTSGTINNYEIVLIDNFVSPNQRHLFQGKFFKLINLTENEYISFQTEGIKNLKTTYKLQGNLKLNPKKEFFENTYKFEGNIGNLNIKEIAPYTHYKLAEGNIDCEFKLNQANGLLKLQNKNTIKTPVIVPDINLNLKKGDILIKGELNKDTFNISELSSTLNNINGKINGSINGWSKDNSILNINIATNDFNLKNLYGTIPEIRSNYDLINYVDQYKIKGIAKINLNIAGNKNKPKLLGDINLSKISFCLPNNTNINNVNSNLNFNGNTITLKDGLIPLTSKEYIKISGSYDPNKNSLSQLMVMSNTINLQNLKSILVGILKSNRFPTDTLNNSTFNGTSKISLILNGNVSKLLVNGDIFIDIKNLKSSAKNNILKNLTGNIVFKGKRLVTKDFNLTLSDNSKIDLDIDYDFYNKIVKLADFKANQMDLNSFQRVILYTSSNINMPEKELKRYQVTGNSSVDLRFNGPINNLDSDGKVVFKNAEVYDTTYKTTIKNINGLINFKNGIQINNLSGYLQNNKILVSGYKLSNRQGQFKIKIPQFKLNDLKNLAIKLNSISPNQLTYINKTNFSGSISGDIVINESGSKFIPSATLKINPGKVHYPALAGNINIQKGAILINNNTLNINNVVLTRDKSIFIFNGKVYNLISRNQKFDFDLVGEKISFETIKRLTESRFAPKEIKSFIAHIENSSGFSTISVKARNNNYQLSIKPSDFNLKTNILKGPIERVNGEIKLVNNTFEIINLMFNYGSSNIKFNGSIKNIKKSPHINIATNGYISPLDFSEFLTEEFKNKIVFSDPINISGSFLGNVKDWNFSFDSLIPEDAEVIYKGIFKKPKNTIARLSLASKGHAEGVSIENISLELGESKINASGDATFSEKEFLDLENLKISSPTIDLDQFNNFIFPELIKEKFAGKIDGDIKLDGSISAPDIIGNVSFNNVSLPLLKIKNTGGQIIFNGDSGEIKDFHLNINDIIMDINSHISNFKGLPVELSNLTVKSPSVNITDLITIALQFGNMPPPITIKNGSIDFKEAIIDKLITTDFTGNVMLCDNGEVQVNNLKFNSAGGSAKGNIYSNIMDSEIGAQLKVVGIKANAAATILLALPNEVFGDLNATIIFDSKGSTYEEMLGNAKGRASLIISNGRFKKLGTLEHLLTASNIIQGGIKGFNLNNLLATIIPVHTGQFELLTGDITAEKGILITNNLISRGKNLSLELNGKYNMANEDANMQIKGHLSKNVSGLLGPLGKLNLSTITDFIPGLGFIPGVAKKRGILDFIPGLGFIPGFGGTSDDKKTRNFAVDIKGKLYDMSSVKNFRWTNE